MYIYPDNLKAKATMWLWGLKDLAIVGIIILFSVFAFAYAGVWFPLVIAGAYAFLTIQVEDTTIMDFIRYACAYFFMDQQQYDCLTEGGPVTAGILHHQPRHADSGGGGEQCLMKRRPDPLYCGDRQHQHQRPQQDHARKAEDHNLKRSQMPL